MIASHITITGLFSSPRISLFLNVNIFVLNNISHIHTKQKLSRETLLILSHGSHYLLQFDLIWLEDIQDTTTPDFWKILPQVKPGGGISQQTDLGDSFAFYCIRGFCF